MFHEYQYMTARDFENQERDLFKSQWLMAVGAMVALGKQDIVNEIVKMASPVMIAPGPLDSAVNASQGE